MFSFFDSSFFLSLTFFFPLFGILFFLFIPSSNFYLLHLVSLLISLITFILSLFLFIQFDPLSFGFQFLTPLFRLPYFNLSVTLGLDAISLFFILLSTFLIPLCILLSRNSVKFFVKEYLLAFLLLE